jgi:hypothetical protein
MSVRHAALRRRFEHDVMKMRDEGQGVWQIAVVSPATVVVLFRSAMSGNAAAATMLGAAAQFDQQINARRSRADALLCLLCDTPLSRNVPPAAISVLTVYRAEPRDAIGLGICPDCTDARSAEQLTHDVLAQLRSDLLTDLRVIPAPCRAGHA